MQEGKNQLTEPQKMRNRSKDGGFNLSNPVPYHPLYILKALTPVWLCEWRLW